MSDSQKFIARNRAPRVQIEYDVELYGAAKKVQLPFVMGVLSDLSGTSPQPAVADRGFLEIDVDNFDDRMRALAPRAQFSVPNTLTGEGSLGVDLTFDKMADFTPQAIAEKVEPLRPLLEARRQLTDLMTYMDGKAGAEALIEQLLTQPGLLQTLTDGETSDSNTEAALASLRAALPTTQSPQDTTGDVLSELAGRAPVDASPDTSVADVLGTLGPAPVAETQDDTGATLAGLRATEMTQTPEADTTGDVLAGIARTETPQDTDETADVLSGLAGSIEDTAPEDTSDDILSGITRVMDTEAKDTTDAVLSGIAPATEVETFDTVSTQDILSTLDHVADVPDADNLDDILSSLETAAPAAPVADDIDDVLSGIAPTPEAEVDDDTRDILAGLPETLGHQPDAPTSDDILAGIDTTNVADPAPAMDDLDDLLADLGSPAEETSTSDDETATTPPETDDLDALFADLDAAADVRAEPEMLDVFDDPLTDTEAPAPEQPDTEASAGLDDLDDLLADLDGPTVSAEPQETPEDADVSPPDADDFDALFADLEDTSDAGSEPARVDGLDDLLADFETPEPAQTDPQEPDDLDAMLADLDGGAAPTDSPPPQSPFGTISAARPEREALNRTKFRMALFGDFSGRAARGAIETGAALATRPAVVLDVDTLDEVIARFATTLTLPIGKNGSGVSVELSEIDDLHPDEIYDKLGIFAEIAGLRQQLGMGSMAEKATERLKQWSEAYGTPIRLPKRSGATSIPAHVKLSDFQSLIGDTSGRLSEPGPADDLIAQIVGPHIVKAPDAGAAALADATDQALSTAMRLVLHHPDFQAVEAQWRSLELLARRIETGSDLEIVLYDVSAEELAIDLAASEDLAESGFFRLLTDVLDPEDGAGGFSAVLGLYTFEETPTHAELLARIGQVAAHVDAPFVTAMTPAYLDVAKEDRHPLTAKSWDRLRARPEAAYLGLASPRFLLRRPYGARSEPIDAFTFEEFSHGEGLKGMLWANPAVLVAILLAATYKKDGAALDLGSVMSLGDIPFHYVTDRFGDQVALPCTERNLTADPVQHTLGRGFMPVIWLKGRDEIRLGSFRALGGEEIAGPWSGEAPAPRKAPDTPAGDIEMELPVADPAAQAALDDLLAGFDDTETDDENDTGDDDDMDPELAALLEGL